MRESQYTDEYLAINAARGEGNGLTVYTFLQYTLRGEAKRYMGKYAQALINSLENRCNVYEGKSCHGKTAYYEDKTA